MTKTTMNFDSNGIGRCSKCNNVIVYGNDKKRTIECNYCNSKVYYSEDI